MLKATGQRPGRFSFRPPFSAWGARLTVVSIRLLCGFCGIGLWTAWGARKPPGRRRAAMAGAKIRRPHPKKKASPRPAGDPVAGLRARSGSLPFSRQIFKNSAHRPGKAARIHIKKSAPSGRFV